MTAAHDLNKAEHPGAVPTAPGLRSGLVLLLVLLSATAMAQPRVRAALPAVPQNGFYRIALPAPFTASCRADLSDLRVVPAGGAPAAYFFDTARSGGSLNYERCPILEMRSDSTQSFIEIAVPPHRTDRLQFSFANTSARRAARISGSRDRKQWYSLEDHISLAPTAVTETVTSQTISFPANDYPFIRLQVFNNGMDPMEILEVGFISGGSAAPLPRPIGVLRAQQQDSNGHSRILLYNTGGNLLDEIRLVLSGPPYFSRNSSLYARRGGQDHLITDLLLGPGQLSFSFPALNDSLLLIDIENGDNPPLHLDSVEALQKERRLVAWLESGKTYALEAGDPQLRAPQYDLAGFREQVPDTLPLLEPTSIASLASASTPVGAQKNYVIWIALLAGMGLLALLTVRLLRDMKQKNA